MPTPDPQTVTQLLEAAEAGHSGDRDRLWKLVYDQLREMASDKMARERADHTLQPTALVHEAYFRVFGKRDDRWHNRRHFFGAAARAMERILVEHARRRNAIKRGGDRERIALDDAAISARDESDDSAISEALTRLERIDPRKAETVRLRYFAGLSVEDTARVLEVSSRTVESEWHFARAWLHRELEAVVGAVERDAHEP